jgi:hypothetical protein
MKIVVFCNVHFSVIDYLPLSPTEKNPSSLISSLIYLSYFCNETYSNARLTEMEVAASSRKAGIYVPSNTDHILKIIILMAFVCMDLRM